MKRCLICLFLCLTKLGCRNCLIRTLAFQPPKLPTYTLRSPDFIRTTTSKLSRQGRSKNTISSFDIDCLDPKENLRIHRVSSRITERDHRPYNTTFSSQSIDRDFIEKKNSQKESDRISFSEVKKQLNVPQYITANFYYPRNPLLYPTQELKLINYLGLVVDIENPEDLKVTAYYVRTSTNNTIPLVFVQVLLEFSDYLIIYSHPNATDLGLMLDNYLDLAYNLKINVLGYDYTGYGQSTGSPSDLNAIADIQATYDFATTQLGFSWEKIVLYGQSIGSGPSVTLASDYRYPIGGLILHAGLASGLRAIDPDLDKTYYADIFPNIDLIQYVNCLVYILHGQNDRQILAKSALQCAEQVRNLYRVWIVEEGGHNNLEYEERFRTEYFLKLREFVREVKVRNAFYRQSELLKLYRATRWENVVEHCYRERFKSQVSQHTVSSKRSQLSKGKHPSEISDLKNRGSVNTSEVEMEMPLRPSTLDLSPQSKRRFTEQNHPPPLQLNPVQERHTTLKIYSQKAYEESNEECKEANQFYQSDTEN